MTVTVLGDLAVALGLGLLVGLQRERAAGTVAGIRTFALIALAGAVLVLARRELFLPVMRRFGVGVAAGAALLLFWPG